jgi:hypothetical protein
LEDKEMEVRNKNGERASKISIGNQNNKAVFSYVLNKMDIALSL